jgi:hypothetical protein
LDEKIQFKIVGLTLEEFEHLGKVKTPRIQWTYVASGFILLAEK